MKAIIVYESMFGTTKKVAEAIAENLNNIEKIETVIKTAKDVDPMEVLDYDLILIGSPNHMGGPTRGFKKFIGKLEKTGLKGKKGATFDTYVRKNINKAVRKMERKITEKVPGLELITHGLSIKVGGISGPVLEEELPKCKEFANTLINKDESLRRRLFLNPENETHKL